MTARELSWTATATKSLSHLPEKVGTAVIKFVYGALALEPDRGQRAVAVAAPHDNRP